MPIDVEKVVGANLPGAEFSWSDDDIMLYNLAVGAGVPPTDPGELRYVYEGDLTALPTFGVVPPFAVMMGMGAVPGLEINLAQVLHGEHELEVHQPIPTSGTVTQSGRVTGVYDKGKGALLIMEVVSVLEKNGQPLFTNRPSIYLRGEGGFGGESGPPPGPTPPERDPDHLAESPTLPQQALLYRLAGGDRNPLHADPGFAGFAGFERPILHGLCTYGVVAKAVIDHALDGDPARLFSWRARFLGHVFPGETLVTRIWDQDEELVVRAEVKERGTTVLSSAALRPTT